MGRGVAGHSNFGEILTLCPIWRCTDKNELKSALPPPPPTLQHFLRPCPMRVNRMACTYRIRIFVRRYTRLYVKKRNIKQNIEGGLWPNIGGAQRTVAGAQHWGTGGVSYTYSWWATAPPTFRFAPLQLCALPHQLVSDSIILAGLKTIIFHCGLAKLSDSKTVLHLGKFLFARFSKEFHQLTWHFAPPTFPKKLHPCIGGALAHPPEIY